MVNRVGVASGRVRLEVGADDAGRDRAERAYQVLVTHEPDGAVTRDSGRVESSCSADVAYAGVALAAGGRYSWKVRIWDENQAVSE